MWTALMQHMWFSLELTWRCDKIRLLADAALIIYVD